jgi:ABC-type antimicrobial peptide transport system permease subunit
LKTLDMQIDQTHTVDRLFAWLSIAFAVSATLLASIGLYGLMAFAVARRRVEIGIRLALGADRSRILHLVINETLLLSFGGIGFGVLLSLWLVKFVQSQLYWSYGNGRSGYGLGKYRHSSGLLRRRLRSCAACSGDRSGEDIAI